MSRTLRLLMIPAALVAAGCSRPAGPPTPPTAAAGEHAHKPAAHGGLVVEIGRDSYHAEAVFERDGVLRLYTLGQDEGRVIEVEARPLAAFAKPAGGTEATPFTLRPDPQPGDTPGQTSRFSGTLPRELWGKPVEVTIPTLRIGGERFRVGFSSAAHPEPAMPAKVADAEERELYLTPGGKYTAADVAANGTTTASAKFKGVPATHDIKPRPGDPLCPVTLTKANPAFAWVVGGRTYLFCCPPCVDEFVRLAKEKPDEVKPPDAYRQP